eukprot:3719368-Pyramimonas_sp.AAC.1
MAAGAAPAGGGPPSQGTWPRAIIPSLWETDATHNENLRYVVFNGRVVARQRHRICRDGALVTTCQAHFDDISRIVHLILGDQNGRYLQQIIWNVIFSQEWSAFEFAFSHGSIRTWVYLDEEVTDAGQSTLSDEEKALMNQRLWTDDGRYICSRFHAGRAGFGYCLQCLARACKLNVRVNYLQSPAKDALVAAWTSLGLAPRLDARPQGDIISKRVSNRLKAMKKSFSDASAQ